jgi:hypothetical protein
MAKPRVFQTATNTYHAKGSIGEGGCGTVYRVTDTDGGSFALKLLRNADGTKLKRFRNELGFCRRNQHDRIIKILDEGVLLDGPKRMPFYVMPLYESTLRKLMSGHLPHNDILPMFTDVLDGLEAAHFQNVVHRDLKPENLLIEIPSRRVVVADFGIAHFEEEDLLTIVKTATDDRLANYRYSAPEQRAATASVDRRADIFALGLILNEMFTGEVPQGTGHTPIAATAPDFGYLDPLVEKMIRQNPSERPASIAAIKNELQLSGVEFAAHQKLDEARRMVVPATAPDDPLGGADVEASRFGYAPGFLTFQLQPAPPALWILALRNLGSYRSYGSAEPARIDITPNGATVPAREETVAEVAEMVQGWVRSANAEYRKDILARAQQEERRRREALATHKQRLEEQARAIERLRKASLA